MKHTTYFNTFLKDAVNINDTRLAELRTRVDAVYSALKSDAVIGDMVINKIPQGSWPHRTIIRPRAGGEFDADFLLVMSEQGDWSPSQYPNAVYAALGRSPHHKDMPRGRSARAVHLDYAPQDDIGCHLDIVPYLTLGDGRTVIVDRDIDDWEETDPEGFTDWMRERDDITGGRFRQVVRLLKYVKRERGSFNGVRSVVLTVIAGMQVDENRQLNDLGHYEDLPTAFHNIVQDLNTWLQQNVTKPSVPNPGGGTGVTFDHRWTQETYSNFRGRFAKLAEDVEAAFRADSASSVEAWQEVFGGAFNPPGATPKSTGRFGPTPTERTASRSGMAG